MHAATGRLRLSLVSFALALHKVSAALASCYLIISLSISGSRTCCISSLFAAPCRWTEDEVFGSVLSCNRTLQNLIVLDPVDYGEQTR